jgi:hypothetical protein
MWLRRLNLGLESMARNGFHVVGATSVPSTRSRFLTGDDDAIERGDRLQLAYDDLQGVGRSVTADTALRLARYFNTDPRFWLNAQVAHDLSKAETEVDLRGVPRRAA